MGWRELSAAFGQVPLLPERFQLVIRNTARRGELEGIRRITDRRDERSERIGWGRDSFRRIPKFAGRSDRLVQMPVKSR